MRTISTRLLQLGVVVVGACALIALLWEPHLEGRNIGATLFEIYFNDPFLAYIYISFIPFFIALYQLFRILGYVGQNKTYSQMTVKALRTIRTCSLTTATLVAGAVTYIVIAIRGKDDIAGGVAMGLGIIFICLIAAGISTYFMQAIRKVVNSE